MNEIKLHFDPAKMRLVDPKTLKIDSKNSNKHPTEQIERMVKLYQTFGMRWPILVSERSDVIKAGELRLLAALKCKMPQVWVTDQYFGDEVEEYAFGVSDNAIASWATLDLAQINTNIGVLGPFDIEILAIKNFNVEPADRKEDKIDLNPQWIVAVNCTGEQRNARNI